MEWSTDKSSRTKKEFQAKHVIDNGTFKASGITWKELLNIQRAYKSMIPDLRATAEDIVNRLFTARKVHSIRYRIKNPENLMAKIVRKRAEDANRDITKTNFTDEIRDLIGIRVLHLYKGDWRIIHRHIDKTYHHKERAKAYIREGDNTEIYDKEGCPTEVHEHSYRSVHYVIESSPTKNTHLAEVQVRTLFEESWSEIDHDIRYPHNTGNVELNYFLGLFNRIAGSADEMGTFIKMLDLKFIKMEIEHREDIENKDRKISALKAQIDLLEITAQQKADLNHQLENIPVISPLSFNFSLLDPFKIPSLAKPVIDTSRLVELAERWQSMGLSLPVSGSSEEE